jgi:hypothetical protein
LRRTMPSLPAVSPANCTAPAAPVCQ